MTSALHCIELRHTYTPEHPGAWVLDGVDFQINRGESCVLCGPSGSGKTTLLSIAGCLLTPSHGELRIGNVSVDSDSKNLAYLRRTRIGFVFQHAQLLPFLNVRDNLEIVAQNLELDEERSRVRIDTLLERLEMSEHASKPASVLSGGQRQRVAVIRALLGSPSIILADEPTAALGWEIGQVVVDLLVEEAKKENCGLLVVTHDTRLLPKFERHFEMDRGKLHETSSTH